MFEDSVRGLNEDAPVEFRGIKVGKVTGISFEYAPQDPARRVPVQIRIDPPQPSAMVRCRARRREQK